MASFAEVLIHESQFPQRVRKDLATSLRTREINHKFHYESIKQTQKWLAIHETYSPARIDPDCERIYDQAFAAAAQGVAAKLINLIGLGAGGGRKDARLLELLSRSGKDIAYRPVEGGTAMALTARAEALKVIAPDKCFPLVCDLANTKLSDISTLRGRDAAARIFTFFGMLPNFEPDIVLPEFAEVLRSDDVVLVSANLAPGSDYVAGVRKIMPLYDNALTRDWLMTFLFDLGIEKQDGTLAFSMEDGPAGSGLKRIVARFEFTTKRTVQVESDVFAFAAGESIRLFFSYRHTPELLEKMLRRHGLRIVEQWITSSGEEGVFRIGRA